MSGKEAPGQKSAGTLAQRRDFPAIKAMSTRLYGEIKDVDVTQDTEEFVHGILEDVLNADSDLAVFEAAESGVTSGKDFVGIPFYLQLQDLSFALSSFESGAFPFYARLGARVIASGEHFPVACGGLTVVAQLYRLRELAEAGKTDLFKPAEGAALVFVAIPTASGNTGLRLAPVAR